MVVYSVLSFSALKHCLTRGNRTEWFRIHVCNLRRPNMARKRTATYDSPAIHFEPRTDAQQEACDIYNENDVTFLLGPAGTGKTHLAVYCALYDMFARIKKRRC